VKTSEICKNTSLYSYKEILKYVRKFRSDKTKSKTPYLGLIDYLGTVGIKSS